VIDRYSLVHRHNPVIREIDTGSPLTVGNGEFAFTCDVTGMQTLYQLYEENHFPLCTMAQWGWHTIPADTPSGVYTQKDLRLTEYRSAGRTVRYPVKCVPGDEKIYRWLRENPHRMDLARIALLAGGEEIRPSDLSDIRQELDLWTGVIVSRFTVRGTEFTVKTCADPEADRAAFEIQASPAGESGFSVLLAFPYGSPEMSGADFAAPGRHSTGMTCVKPGREWRFARRLDRDSYGCSVECGTEAQLSETRDPHRYLLSGKEAGKLSFSVLFTGKTEDGITKDTMAERRNTAESGTGGRDSSAGGVSAAENTRGQAACGEDAGDASGPEAVFLRSAAWWAHFWETTGAIDFSGSTDPRAEELERRIILSQYLLAAQDTGSCPPAETGLSCNSWYGKFHLEMTFWHEAWLPLYGHSDLLMRTLPWYLKHLPQARRLARDNGYKGARWPKQCGPDADNSPSPIAPLLIWQQPHILFLLYLVWKAEGDVSLLREYADVIRETADFCADFAVKNPDGYYELPAPLIPVQECWPPEKTRNPVFELEYWVFGLRAAAEMTAAAGGEIPPAWIEVSDRMILPETDPEGRIRAVSGARETYGRYAVDHPSFLMGYGLFDNGRLDPAVIGRSLESCLSVWDEESLWGWDFAVMAMAAARLGNPGMAVDLLMKKTVKNVYVASGNNRQATRDDLPLYLPGNGSLLIAAAMMAAGWPGCGGKAPGFPEKGWNVRTEGILSPCQVPDSAKRTADPQNKNL
jgi:hypothetical protein